MTPTITPPLAPTIAPTPEPTPPQAPTADATGCPLDDAGNFALAARLDRWLIADGRRIELVTAGIGARNGSWQADDVIPQFATLDLGWSPAVVNAGGNLGIAGSPGMQLTGGYAHAWKRAQITGGTSGTLVVVHGPATDLQTTVRQGQLAIWFPAGAETWVVELMPRWQTACLHGDGVAYAIVRTK